MQSGRDKLANMTKEERREYLADYRQLTDEQRLAKISEELVFLQKDYNKFSLPLKKL